MKFPLIEMIEKARDGVLSQGGPAVHNVTSACMYRTEDGMRCAVGQMIPEDKYHPDLERRDPTGVIRMVYPEYELDRDMAVALGRFQDIHDYAAIELDFLDVFERKTNALLDELKYK